MNSYPPELLTQLAPVMFAAGLDAPATQQASQDPFSVLAFRLREAFLAQRKISIWQPEKQKTFQVILIDKEAKFPPRKTVPPDDPQYPSAHSPLSPLTPTSPLHPDGLIAPIWVRKHTTMVPSVFVLFLRIYESPLHNPRSPLDAPDADFERQREQEERRRDAELSAEVALRKKSTNERGIKLTVVLMASRRMLDDPSLDQRLTYIRRQSGLDSRAALFVLSPVSAAELGDFIKSLQEALYESALEYYTAHSKRVRRKRNRHSHTISTYPNPLSPVGAAPMARPLRSEGWTVRYEYKMACFAEFRSEDEVALKHYQDAYDMLVIMFGSTAILPPRTKRWAEAKVLVDCINIKITKLYLYNNEHALALSHHTTHMRKFGDFSRGWGIGEETFEYWSWMARQYRVLSELLEQGTRSTLRIPTHKPAAPPSAAALVASQLTSSVTTIKGVEFDAMRSLGLNPSHALQHPGFYYYMAAKCTEMRRERFQAALEAEMNQQLASTFPGYANEKKVDHYVIILELYTKSYELFKKYGTPAPQKQNQGRLTLWIAYCIAQTYYDSGKYDMAVRFFERIAKTYRRERWVSMLRPLLSTWYACAQRLGDVELSIRLLIEVMGCDADDIMDPAALQEDLIAITKSSMPSSEDQALVVDLPESRPLFDTQAVFWVPDVKVNEPAAFQLSLTSPPRVDISNLPIISLTIHFSGDISPIVVNHDVDSEEPSLASIRRVDVGTVSNSTSTPSHTERLIKTKLRWAKDTTVVFSGSIVSALPGTYEITQIIVAMREGSWLIEVPFDSQISRLFLPKEPRWLSALNPPKFVPVKRSNCSSVQIRYCHHNIAMTISQNAPAYLDESYPIVVEVTNSDEKELEVIMDVLLQPAEIDDAISSISIDDEHSSGLIKGIRFGTLASGDAASKTLYLSGRGAPGNRMIDISIQSRPPSIADDDEEDNVSAEENHDLLDVSETLQTLVVPTVAPFKTTYSVAYRRNLADSGGIADMKTFENDYWDDSNGGEAILGLHLAFAGPWNIQVESFTLIRQNTVHARIVDAFSDEAGVMEGEYVAGDEISDTCRVSLASSDDDLYKPDSIVGPGVYEICWHRFEGDAAQPTATTTVPLPFLRTPRDTLVALLTAPPTAQLHKPVLITLTVRNHHPTRAANIFIQLEPDPSDAFVVAGLRSSRLPIMMPGSTEKVTWRLIPLECGYVKIPRIRVTDRRKAIASAQGIGGPNAEVDTEGEAVKIIDVAMDRRTELPAHSHPASDASDQTKEGMPTIFVLPNV